MCSLVQWLSHYTFCVLLNRASACAYVSVLSAYSVEHGRACPFPAPASPGFRCCPLLCCCCCCCCCCWVICAQLILPLTTVVLVFMLVAVAVACMTMTWSAGIGYAVCCHSSACAAMPALWHCGRHLVLLLLRLVVSRCFRFQIPCCYPAAAQIPTPQSPSPSLLPSRTPRSLPPPPPHLHPHR